MTSPPDEQPGAKVSAAAGSASPADRSGSQGGPVPPNAGLHRVEVDRRGNWARAVCATCGWRGPGRRAVTRATIDGEAHVLLTQIGPDGPRPDAV